jgi:hypothetical protein
MAHIMAGPTYHLLPAKRLTRQGALEIDEVADAHQDYTKNKTPSMEFALLGEAIAWPYYTLERKCYAPMVAFGAMTFFGVPFFFPGTTPGMSFLLGYASGSFIYFAQNYNEPTIHEKSGNH